MCKHHWILNSTDKGVCKLCGKHKDFSPPPERLNRMELKHVRELCTTNGYYMQGRFCVDKRSEI